MQGNDSQGGDLRDSLASLLANAQLTEFDAPLRQAGCIEADDVADMGDATLISVGLTEVQVKRLRRKLAAPGAALVLQGQPLAQKTLDASVEVSNFHVAGPAGALLAAPAPAAPAMGAPSPPLSSAAPFGTTTTCTQAIQQFASD